MGLRDFLIDFFKALFHFKQIRKGTFQIGMHRDRFFDSGLLVQIADAQLLIPFDGALIGKEVPCEHLDKGCFPCAVQAGQSHFIPAEKGERGIFEKGFIPKGMINIFYF